jgi:hypothetical protein
MEVDPRYPGLLEGSIGSEFFDPLPEAELEGWEADIGALITSDAELSQSRATLSSANHERR